MSARAMRWTLAASLAVNLALITVVGGWIVNRGGVRYVARQFGIGPKNTPSEVLRERFESYPDTPGEIVFAGDSIVARMRWAEYFTNIKNRGIGGDTTARLFERLDEITRAQPAKVFIGVGVNDLLRDASSDQAHDGVLRVVERIAADSPETLVLVQSVLPVNAAKLTSANGRRLNTAIRELNRQLASTADEKGYRFIDLTEAFADADGQLAAAFTDDGVHLTAAGQKAHAAAIESFLNADPERRDVATPVPVE